MFYSEGGATFQKLLGQGYVKDRLKSSLRKSFGRYGDLIKQNEVPLSWMLRDILEDDLDFYNEVACCYNDTRRML